MISVTHMLHALSSGIEGSEVCHGRLVSSKTLIGACSEQNHTTIHVHYATANGWVAGQA